REARASRAAAIGAGLNKGPLLGGSHKATFFRRWSFTLHSLGTLTWHKFWLKNVLTVFQQMNGNCRIFQAMNITFP
ncbi:hypothetical protein O7R08_23025, partial [Vibrio alginolyticus]|uniref:hypothetical protein n=1 Tax=Vibrio alginolyticus TaxID=663 RepID=UPI0022DDAFB6